MVIDNSERPTLRAVSLILSIAIVTPWISFLSIFLLLLLLSFWLPTYHFGIIYLASSASSFLVASVLGSLPPSYFLLLPFWVVYPHITFRLRGQIYIPDVVGGRVGKRDFFALLKIHE